MASLGFSLALSFHYLATPDFFVLLSLFFEYSAVCCFYFVLGGPRGTMSLPDGLSTPSILPLSGTGECVVSLRIRHLLGSALSDCVFL